MGRMKDLLLKVEDRAWQSLNHAERAYLRSIDGHEPPGRCQCLGCQGKRGLGITDTFETRCECRDCTAYQAELRRDVARNLDPGPSDLAILEANASF